MLKNITRILPFLIVTLLAIGGVELFYGVLEHYLLPPKKAEVIRQADTSTDTPGIGEPKQHKSYDVIVERNLFQSLIEDETAVETEDISDQPVLDKTTLDLVLLGTISGEEGSSRAIILDKTKSKQDIFYEGDFVLEAEIKEIMRGKVILSYAGKDEILDMSEAAANRPKQADKPAVSPSAPRKRVVSRPPPEVRRRIVPPRAKKPSGGAIVDDDPFEDEEESIGGDEPPFDDEGEISEDVPEPEPPKTAPEGEPVEGETPEAEAPDAEASDAEVSEESGLTPIDADTQQ